MHTHEFNITIHASPERIWSVLWNEASYREWAAIFYPGTYAEGEWRLGGRLKFLSPGQGGIIAEIIRWQPSAEMQIRYIGLVENGEEILSGPIIEQWGEAIEAYFIHPTNEGTELKVRLSMETDFMDDLLSLWPAALNKIKTLAEA